MKKYLSFIIALLLLSSCTRDKGIDIELLEKADEIFEAPTVTQEDEYVGDYALETSYSAGDLSAVNGIYYTAGQTYYTALADGKYYFDVVTFQTRRNEDGSTNSGTARISRSMNLETGESFYLCPDPLCTHPYRICKYTNMNCVGYYNDHLYYLRYTYPGDSINKTVEKLDPASGVFSVIIEQSHGFEDNPYTTLGNAYVVKNDLFYSLMTIHEDPEKRTQTESYENFRMNLDTMEIMSISEDVPTIHYVSDTAAFGYSAEDASIVRTDVNYQNPVIITPPEGYPNYGDMQVDENTGEIFVLMLEPDRKYGALCEIVEDRMEIVSLPHGKITEFQLTRDKIYYSAYDPVELGPGRNKTMVTMDSGGKIYAVDRTALENAELIFSDGVDFNMMGWFVLGDNLYLDSTVLVNEGGGVYFAPSRSLKHVRINLVNHTIRYFRFD